MVENLYGNMIYTEVGNKSVTVKYLLTKHIFILFLILMISRAKGMYESYSSKEGDGAVMMMIKIYSFNLFCLYLLLPSFIIYLSCVIITRALQYRLYSNLQLLLDSDTMRFAD